MTTCGNMTSSTSCSFAVHRIAWSLSSWLLGCAAYADAEAYALQEPPPLASESVGSPLRPDETPLPNLGRPDADDPCAPAKRTADERIAALCSTVFFRDDSRQLTGMFADSALECMLESGYPTTGFVELTRARNPATRTYARQALLRRSAMSLPLIAAGLADPDVVDIHIGRSMSAAEPALAALLMRHDPRSDALLARFLQSSIGRMMLRRGEGWGATAPAALHAVRDPQRSATVRALAGEVEAHAREASALQQRPEYMQPEDPSVLFAAWTRARGHCGDNSEDARHRWAVEEHAEEEQRVRELERVLQEQPPSR